MRTVNKFKTYLEVMLDIKDKVKRVVPVAAGIIVKKGENGENMVLLIQRAADDHWPLHFEFPRGKCDKKGENIIGCLKREVKEETGLDVEPVRFLGKYTYYAEGGERKSICYNYECEMKDPNQKVVFKQTPGGVIEHEGYQWITQLGEAELMVHPDQIRFLQMILSTKNPITNFPENDFTVNNTVEEYLQLL